MMYKHKSRVSWKIIEANSPNKDISLWCHDNLINKWSYDFDIKGREYYFAHQQDKFLFDLTWK